MKILHHLVYPIAWLTSRFFITNPIFIVGSGRSGTSVLLQSLGKHKNILSLPGEAPFLTTIGGAAALFTGSEAEYYKASSKVGQDYLYSRLAQLGLELAGGRGFAFKHIIKKLFNQKRILPSPIKHWAAKTFPPETVAKGLSQVYPNCRYLYILRNGIEVVNSKTKFHGFKDNAFEDQCISWANSSKINRYHSESKNSLLIRHEDLVYDPERVFEQIFDFLGLPHDTDCVKYIQNTLVHPLDQTGRKALNIVEQLKTRSNPYLSWSQQQREVFTSICSEEMLAAGYFIPDGKPTKTLPAMAFKNNG